MTSLQNSLIEAGLATEDQVKKANNKNNFLTTLARLSQKVSSGKAYKTILQFKTSRATQLEIRILNKFG